MSALSIESLIAAGRNDIVVFAEEILGIKLNRAQRRWFRLMTVVNGWEWAYKTTAHVAGNQVGKTVGLAIILLWACLFKIGVPYDSTEEGLQSWMASQYLWFHLAPSQNQAYHVLNDIRQILKGAHAAQEIGRLKFGLKYRLPDGLVWEDTVATYYQGVYFFNGAVLQFRTTEEKAKAILGYRANGISVDEAAFEKHLRQIVNEVLYMRLISTGGPLMLVSTPDGLDDFYEFVDAIIAQAEQADEGRTPLWTVGDRGVTWSTVDDNLGFGYTETEMARMEARLDETTKEAQLRGAFLEPTEAFFRPSDRILRAFSGKLPDSMLPKPGHTYVAFWDPSVSSDPTACIVLDTTKKPWVGVKCIWHRKPLGIDQLLVQMWETHVLYGGARNDWGISSRITTGFDSTSMGGQIISQSLVGLRPVRPLNFGGTAKTKRDALVNLRTALLQGHVILPDSWTPVKREILNYRYPDDKAIQQDLVIAAAGAVAIGTSKGPQFQPFDPSVRVAHAR